MAPLDERVQVMEQYIKPKSIMDLRRFLGIVNFYYTFQPLID
jgi:DMSO/TMAO reductase YedYZ heme-binding membrane subunit